MKKQTPYVGYLLGIAFLFVLWAILASVIDQNTKMPSIASVSQSLGQLISNPRTYSMILGSFTRSIYGFALSLLVAIILGAVTTLFKPFKYFLAPLVASLRAVPTASLILFFLIVVGFRKMPYYLVFIMCFPILYQSIIHGIESLDKELMLVNKLDNTDNFKNFIYVILPLSLPSIVSGMITSFALAVKTQIMGEVLSGDTKTKGLGILLNIFKNELDTPSLFALTLIIITLTLILELVSKWIKSRIKLFNYL